MGKQDTRRERILVAQERLLHLYKVALEGLLANTVDEGLPIVVSEFDETGGVRIELSIFEFGYEK